MNHAHRHSDFITAAQIVNLAAAVDFAYWTGRPLTRFITIHLDKAGVGDQSRAFITIFIARLGDWLRSRVVPLAYISVLENPGEGGLNWHLLIHVPPALYGSIAPMLRTWLRQAGGHWRAGVIKSQALGGPRLKPRGSEYLDNLTRVFLYMVKGCEPDIWDQILPGPRDGIGIGEHRHQPQGRVRGKRVSVSESLSAKARGKHPDRGFAFNGRMIRRGVPSFVLTHVGAAKLSKLARRNYRHGEQRRTAPSTTTPEAGREAGPNDVTS